MRRFTFIGLLLVLLTAVALLHKEEDHTSIPDRLERAINGAPMVVYRDRDFDYVVRHPSFFAYRPSSPGDTKGSSTFSYWMDDVQIDLKTLVLSNSDGQTLQQGMDSLALQLHAIDRRYGEDWFILSGRLPTDDGHLSGQCFYAKCVQHRKLWFIQSLTYPETCHQAVQRLLHEIDRWRVWEE